MDENLVEGLLTVAGSLLEDASVLALVAESMPLPERLDWLARTCDEVRTLVQGAKIVAATPVRTPAPDGS